MATGTTEDFVQYALTWVGVTPYVYGGLSLTAGTDCSGYVLLCAAHYGVTTPRTTQGEWAAFPAGDGSRGDLVLFDVPSDGPPQPQHVGICLGDGTMVNAPHTGVDVRIDPIWNLPGEITVMGYRRLPFNPPKPPPPPLPKGDQMSVAVKPDGTIVVERVSPQGHQLVFTQVANDAAGWSCIDVTDAIQGVHGTQYLVQP